VITVLGSACSGARGDGLVRLGLQRLWGMVGMLGWEYDRRSEIVHSI
jgi:hypothetical protein